MVTGLVNKVVRRFVRDRRGNFATLFAVSAPVVLMALATAVIYSHAVTTRQKMQSAIDSGVLAGAKYAMSNGVTTSQEQSAAITQATNMFNANNIDFPGVTPSFAFNSTGTTLTGTASYTMNDPIMSLTSNGTMTVGVTSQAKLPGYNVCILLLSKTGVASGFGMEANGGANINAPQCEMDTASTNSSMAAVFDGSTDLNLARDCVAGAGVQSNGGSVHPNLVYPCTTAANPYVGKLPAPASLTCTVNNPGPYSPPTTLNPGVYCGNANFNGNPNVTLNPGLYVLKGGSWNISGTVTGTGVTFYFADSSSYITMNGNTSLTLTAPTSGTYKDILFYEPDGLTYNNSIVLTLGGTVSETWSGLIYLPSRNLQINSVSTLIAPAITIIAGTAQFNTMDWTLSPDPNWPIPSAGGSGSGSSALTLSN